MRDMLLIFAFGGGVSEVFAAAGVHERLWSVDASLGVVARECHRLALLIVHFSLFFIFSLVVCGFCSGVRMQANASYALCSLF